MYKLRFNLGRVNYMKWKVTHPNGDVEYLCPIENQFKLTNCKLKIRVNASNKIYDGSNKFPCSWIECETMEKISSIEPYNTTPLYYNPRKNPNWLDGEKIVNNQLYDTIVTENRNVFYIHTMF